MGWQELISMNPAVRSGKPCVKGTRITVCDVLEYLAGGMTEDEILSDFPDLTREDIRACLAFAAARERRGVKLLFDENWSPRLARNEDFAIVSKDMDFRERSYLVGALPKVVWLDVGNAGSRGIEGRTIAERTRVP